MCTHTHIHIYYGIRLCMYARINRAICKPYSCAYVVLATLAVDSRLRVSRITFLGPARLRTPTLGRVQMGGSVKGELLIRPFPS